VPIALCPRLTPVVLFVASLFYAAAKTAKFGDAASRALIRLKND
jgi:hypothetical protein